MKKVKAGVIGTGFIGPVHIEALRRLGYVDVIALADISDEIAQKKAEELSIPAAYGDFKKLLADDEIDVVHICTPNNLHYEMAKAAILAGKHVVCDKPLALTSKEGEELAALAKEKNIVAASNFNVRYYPLIHQIKEMIADGELGEITAVTGSYEQDWLQKETDYSWRLEPDKSGESRAIADIGSHWLDSAEFMTGLKIEKVLADFATIYPTRKKPLKPVETYSGKMLTSDEYEDVPVTTEDYASVLLQFNNHAHGVFTVNQTVAGRKNRIFFEISGTKAAVAFDSETPNELWIGSRDNANGIMIKDPSLMTGKARMINSYPGGHAEGFGDTFKQSFSDIYKYICNPTEANKGFSTFEDGLRDLYLIEKIVESSRDNTWVRV